MAFYSLDYETYSPGGSPRQLGLRGYVIQCEILMLALKEVGEEYRIFWDAIRDPEPPRELVDIFNDPESQFLAHNCQFEREVLYWQMGIETQIEQWHDSMILARTCGLPGALEKVCDALELSEDVAKMKSGHDLIQLFCSPNPKNYNVKRYYEEHKPVEWATFGEYCRRDVEVCEYLWEILPHNTYDHERENWIIDQRINMRGLPVDVALCTSAIEQAQAVITHEGKNMEAITEGAVSSVSQLKRLKEWLLMRDTPVTSLSAATVRQILEEESLESDVREALQIRQRAGKAAVSKYKAIMKKHVGGRVYYSLAFYGAHTGRAAGQGVQPQNMYRPAFHLKKVLHTAVAAIKARAVGVLYDDPIEVLASCTRCAVAASPGKKFVVSDLSNIEGRITAWLAGEEWKLQAFREADWNIGPDIYIASFAKAFGLEIEDVQDFQRQIGKVIELACGFGGGLGAFKTFGDIYNVHLPDKEVLKIVRGWREAHPRIRSFWADVEAGAIAAVKNPGKVMQVRKLHFQVKTFGENTWLLVRLPSGRLMWYFEPEVNRVEVKAKVDDGHGNLVMRKWETDQISYMGTHKYKWQRISSWGGTFTENFVQAIANDILKHGIREAENDGYETFLTVHDELLTECDDSPVWTVDRLSAHLSVVPDWAEGLPLTAAGYEDVFYKKD